MEFINKIKKNIIILILLIVEFFSLILTYKSFNNKKLELNNSVESENRNFAMYLQDENGDYYLSKKTYFPSAFNYQLNKLLSECVDAKGQIIDTDYSFLNGKMIVSSDKTVYCNFYFDLIKDLYQTIATNVQLTDYILVESNHPIETNSSSRYPYTKTFEGATSITVNLTYQLYSSSTSSNYIRIYQASNNTFGTYASSTITTRTITIPTNYISIYWYDGYYTNHYSYYGYRIEITPNYS